MFKRLFHLRLGMSLAAVLLTCSAVAQDTPVDSAPKPLVPATSPGGSDTAALAKATQNPVASLISLPLQNNNNFGIGPYNRTGDIFNIQPVFPTKVSDKVMLIPRVIQPIVWQP